MSEGQVSVSTEIAAEPARVWGLVTDIALMPRFSSELQSVAWADGFDGAALGACFLGVNRHPAVGEWTTRSQIIAFDPPRRFAWAVGDPDGPAATWTFDLQPAPEGTTLSYTARIGPGRSGVTMLIEREPHRAREIVANRLDQFRAGMRVTLEGLRTLAES